MTNAYVICAEKAGKFEGRPIAVYFDRDAAGAETARLNDDAESRWVSEGMPGALRCYVLFAVPVE